MLVGGGECGEVIDVGEVVGGGVGAEPLVEGEDLLGEGGLFVGVGARDGEDGAEDDADMVAGCGCGHGLEVVSGLGRW